MRTKSMQVVVFIGATLIAIGLGISKDATAGLMLGGFLYIMIAVGIIASNI